MTDLTGCFILVVDDEPLVALDTAQCLQSEGASVQTAHAWRTDYAGLSIATSRPQSWTTASVMVRAPLSARA